MGGRTFGLEESFLVPLDANELCMAVNAVTLVQEAAETSGGVKHRGRFRRHNPAGH